MASIKLDVEKFGSKQNFGLWQVKMKAILVQHDVQKALDGVDKMLKGMSMIKWKEIEAKELSAIQLCLSNEVLG